ncbi:MAG: recombinase family protein, partial [Candidatus Dormibacteria bacterium]
TVSPGPARPVAVNQEPGSPRSPPPRSVVLRPVSHLSGFDERIDTSTAVGRMFFQILGAIAEFEHALMAERTRDALAAARARGRTGGQRPKLTPRQARIAQEMYEAVGPDGRRVHTVSEIAAEFRVSRPTIYRRLQRPGL